jgi:hypothetical protein
MRKIFLWCVVCGVWCVVCGVWCVVCEGGVLFGVLAIDKMIVQL